MRTKDDALGEVLFGKAKRAILSQLLGNPDKRFYVRELARAAGVSPSTLSRDLTALFEAGVILRVAEGRNVYYQANAACPVFGELRGIVTKTFGFADILRSMLARVFGRIRVAAIYGSVARGEQTSSSDVDLLIIGDVSTSAFSDELLEAEQLLGRAVSPTIYTESDFGASASTSPFLKAILEKPLVFLKGDANELKRIRQGKARKPR